MSDEQVSEVQNLSLNANDDPVTNDGVPPAADAGHAVHGLPTDYAKGADVSIATGGDRSIADDGELNPPEH